MRTTLVINDELYRRVKAKAALEGRKVTELVEEGLRALLAERTRSKDEVRLKLPVVRTGTQDVTLFAGMTQEEIHRRLADLENSARSSGDALPV